MILSVYNIEKHAEPSYTYQPVISLVLSTYTFTLSNNLL